MIRVNCKAYHDLPIFQKLVFGTKFKLKATYFRSFKHSGDIVKKTQK